MEPRLNIVTLGVRDLEKAIRFYRDGLGWPMSSLSAGDFAIFIVKNLTNLTYFFFQKLLDPALCKAKLRRKIKKILQYNFLHMH